MSVCVQQSPRVVIMMGVYRCNHGYLLEQVDSIINQSHDDWVLLIRDDGSDDDSRVFLESVERRDDRIRLIRDDCGNLGAVGNFGMLSRYATEYYPECDRFMYADQDDVWLFDKIRLTLEMMDAITRQGADDIPYLVHSDLAVVDSDLTPVAPSFMKYQHINHEDTHPLGVLLIQNFVTGCTVMVNRSLLKLALPFPAEAMMHDWWLAMCAAASGRIGYVRQATMLYRQHAANVVGAKGLMFTFLQIVRRHAQLSRAERKRRSAAVLGALVAQSDALLPRLLAEGSRGEETVGMLRDFSRLLHVSPFQRWVMLRRWKIRRQFWLYHYGFLLGVLTARCPTARS